jgi:hypothetical protein
MKKETDAEMEAESGQEFGAEKNGLQSPNPTI